MLKERRNSKLPMRLEKQKADMKQNQMQTTDVKIKSFN